jgi:hypothetical protein
MLIRPALTDLRQNLAGRKLRTISIAFFRNFWNKSISSRRALVPNPEISTHFFRAWLSRETRQ